MFIQAKLLPPRNGKKRIGANIMCGIVGLIAPPGKQADQSIIARMRHLTLRRGPDDNGYASVDFSKGKIRTGDTTNPGSLQLGFTRLSIRDLSHRAHQPMTGNDNQCVLVFNGEIYNTNELIREHLKDTPLKSSSDTEIVLKLCIKLGVQHTLQILDGMFALAFYNGISRKLTLARDRFGIKPLYYTKWNGFIAFASEIKPILKSGLIPTEFDSDALSELALFRYVADPNTPFKNVNCLPPGNLIQINTDGQLGMRNYWSPAYKRSNELSKRSAEENKERFSEILERCVQSQLVADVEVGLELSGGIDSSLVAWAAKNSQLTGYSAIPNSTEFSEEPYIDKISNVTGISTNKRLLTPDNIAASLGNVAYHHETPINHEGSIGIYQVCKLAKSEGVSVLLSGEGADELFAGYRRYGLVHQRLSRARLVAKFTSTINRWLPRRLQTANQIWRDRESWLILTTAYGAPHLVKPLFPDADISNAIQRRLHHTKEFNWNRFDESHLVYDQKTYLVDLLARQDKLSMANSVETRVPFLGNEVVEFANQIPMSQLLGKNLQGKVLLKSLVASRFGNNHAYRQKVGFALPYSFMATNETVRELAISCAMGLQKDGIISGTHQVLEKSMAGDGWADRMAWIVLSIGLWYDIFFRSGERVSQYVGIPSDNP